MMVHFLFNNRHTLINIYDRNCIADAIIIVKIQNNSSQVIKVTDILF